MAFAFKIIEKEHIDSVIPLVQKLNGNQVSDTVMNQRFSEMITQNYECAVVYDGDKLIGVCGFAQGTILEKVLSQIMFL